MTYGEILLLPSIFILIEIFIEIIVDSQAVVRNNTETPYIIYPVSPNGSILQNRVQYHNQDIDICAIHRHYPAFPSFTCTHLCVGACVY